MSQMRAPTPEFTLDDYQGAAAFLLELIGRGVDRVGKANFIVMCNDPPRPHDPHDRKYDTIFRHPHLEDCAGHLAGRVTIGGYLTHGEHGERAYLIGYDGDNAEAFARLIEAAERLRASGVYPFLEKANLPPDHGHAGGGKLWLAFPAPVRWRDAQATAERHVPGLQELEHFPPGRVRLPGGLYRRGLHVWSQLCCPSSDDPSWYTGEPAIETMMEHLTPDGWVTVQEAVQANQHADGDEQQTIRTHHRNRTLASLAGTMRRRGMSHAAIEAALLADNETRCDPPLPPDEVRRIAASVSRYAPAPPLPIRRPRVRVRVVAPHA